MNRKVRYWGYLPGEGVLTVEIEYGRDGGDKHYNSNDARCQKGNGRAGQTEFLENSRSVEEDGIDTIPLPIIAIEYCLEAR
jgi:hypothetical protein